jgi:hypothetical protein
VAEAWIVTTAVGEGIPGVGVIVTGARVEVAVGGGSAGRGVLVTGACIVGVIEGEGEAVAGGDSGEGSARIVRGLRSVHPAATEVRTRHDTRVHNTLKQ